ncbi:hypothetical protein EYC84_000648 [Monilinia fructicola]|uniref:Uncharacterized protein n=1 Tax=Monilinia fructicola TaxID=38448 RepID=A0A5M9JP93_MONFR|nr:hypothetical protein EYC84_000648 [Monilinia fructicola]
MIRFRMGRSRIRSSALSIFHEEINTVMRLFVYIISSSPPLLLSPPQLTIYTSILIILAQRHPHSHHITGHDIILIYTQGNAMQRSAAQIEKLLACLLA